MKKVEKEKKKVSKKEDVVKVSEADETIEDKVDGNREGSGRFRKASMYDEVHGGFL